MIRRIEIENFRGVRKMAVDLREFQVLVGANGSGKSSLLDALAFVGDFMRDGLDAAFAARTNNPETLFYGKKFGSIKIAVEFDLFPQWFWRHENLQEIKLARYELELRSNLKGNGNIKFAVSMAQEQLRIADSPIAFSSSLEAEISLLDWLESDLPPTPHDSFYVFRNDSFAVDWGRSHGNRAIQVHQDRSAIGGIAPHEEILRVMRFVSGKLSTALKFVHLEGDFLKKPSPPRDEKISQSKGSFLPWAVKHLIDEKPDDFQAWLQQVRRAIPKLLNVQVVEREEDRHAYLVIVWANRLALPSWAVSEGILRLMALTVLAMGDYQDALLLIEEPENGIHPQALQTVIQSLQYVNGAQVLITSHSPVAVNRLEAADLLCFSYDDVLGVSAITGDQHPMLASRDRVDLLGLGDIFAAGILDLQP